MGAINPDQGSWSNFIHAAQEELIKDVPEQPALMPRLQEYLHRGLEKVG